MNNLYRKAYTLAEIVIVMLIISVIAGVSIKIARMKLSKITPITYYSAYSTLKNANTEILRDFSPTNEYLQSNNNILKYFFNSAFAASTCPDEIPCGKECNASTNYELADISGFSRTCDEVDQQWNENNCGCVPVTQTLPRKGSNYCKLFANYVNTSSESCNGSNISADTASSINFNNKIKDVILRNGMYIYNLRQNPTKITALNGNSKGSTFTKDDGTEIDVDEWGYTIYVDIDGKNNSSGKLWEDVFPFYITLSGIVVPAYDMTNGADEIGGNSKDYLQTSVSDENSINGTHQINWITKSKSFKESACKMGYLQDTSTYCSTAPAYTKNVACTQEGHDCRFHYITPIKFF